MNQQELESFAAKIVAQMMVSILSTATLAPDDPFYEISQLITPDDETTPEEVLAAMKLAGESSVRFAKEEDGQFVHEVKIEEREENGYALVWLIDKKLLKENMARGRGSLDSKSF